jgi:DUF1680 family protein
MERKESDPLPSDRHPDRALSRREALRALGAGGVGLALGAGLPAGLAAEVARRPRIAPPSPTPSAPAAPGALPFTLRDVRLLESPFRDAQARDARYLLSLEPDRLLHNFRVNAGLPPKAPVYGGWESQEPWVEIRCHGHTLGHYLSASSMMYASTDDERFRGRVDYIVSELAACQEAGGSGLVCAFPDGAAQLENSVSGRPFVGVPWYTMHKIFAGLRDAHLHAHSPAALPVLVRLSDWAWDATSGMSDEQMQRMLDREHGGMNEVLADVHVLTGDPRYLTLARRFSHRALLEPLSHRRDTLDGLHSNTQIPKVIGFQRIHELTAEPELRTASRFFWEAVVKHRSFVTGGNGDQEHFFPPADFEKHLGSAKTMETCCTHNLLRLTRALFTDSPSAEYTDYYERALYNGILASQDPDSGMMTYFQATRPGYLKLYHTPTESFWCCTGSGMENHAKYGDSLYFHDADRLWVNLFVPSTVKWAEKGLKLTQTTRFPEEETTRLAVAAERPVRATLLVRHPGWCRDLAVTVNGRPWPSAGEPGSYVALDREWRDGDTVEVRLPMTLRTEPLPGSPDRVAVLYGPIVLAGRLGSEGITPGADLIRNERTSGDVLNADVEVPVLVGDADGLVERIRPVPGAPLTFRTVGLGRPHDVTLIPYWRIAHERYNLYWKVAAPGTAAARGR